MALEFHRSLAKGLQGGKIFLPPIICQLFMLAESCYDQPPFGL